MSENSELSCHEISGRCDLYKTYAWKPRGTFTNENKHGIIKNKIFNFLLRSYVMLM